MILLATPLTIRYFSSGIDHESLMAQRAVHLMSMSVSTMYSLVALYHEAGVWEESSAMVNATQ